MPDAHVEIQIAPAKRAYMKIETESEMKKGLQKKTFFLLCGAYLARCASGEVTKGVSRSKRCLLDVKRQIIHIIQFRIDFRSAFGLICFSAVQTTPFFLSFLISSERVRRWGCSYAGCVLRRSAFVFLSNAMNFF